jgi:hypothetical protein
MLQLTDGRWPDGSPLKSSLQWGDARSPRKTAGGTYEAESPSYHQGPGTPDELVQQMRG